MNTTQQFETEIAPKFAAVLKKLAKNKDTFEYNTRDDTGDALHKLNEALGKNGPAYRLHKLFGTGQPFEIAVYKDYFTRCKKYAPWTVVGIDIENLKPETLAEAKRLHVKATKSLETPLYAMAGHRNYRLTGDRWAGVIDKPNSKQPIYRITFKQVGETAKAATEELKKQAAKREAAKAKKNAQKEAQNS